MRIPAFHRSVWLAAAAACAASAALSGCSSGSVAARPREPIVGDQGGQWEAVFLPASTAAAVEVAGPGGEGARRDAALSVRGPEVLLASSQWPGPARATLERPRRVRLERDARDLLFFTPRRSHHHHDHPQGHAHPRHVWP